MSSSIIDLTEYWRADDTMYRKKCFLTLEDAAAHIRSVANRMRTGRINKDHLKEIEDLCKAIEHDYFEMIGMKVSTNETPSDKSYGPNPVEGTLVAILPSGQGLVVTEKFKLTAQRVATRHGYIAGHYRMADLHRKLVKKK